jgi:hypothetical protein
VARHALTPLEFPRTAADVEVAEPDFARRMVKPAGTSQGEIEVDDWSSSGPPLLLQSASGGAAQPTAMPDDTYYTARNTLWHLNQIQAPVAWETTTGSREVRFCLACCCVVPAPAACAHLPSQLLPPPAPQVKVCIIDTGLRRDHEEFLDGRVIKGWNRCGVTWQQRKPRATHLPAAPSALFELSNLPCLPMQVLPHLYRR